MTATGTAAIYQQLRDRILGFIPLDGQPVSGTLNSRLWVVSAPDNATFPFGTMRLINQKTNVGDAITERQEADLEVLLYARPRSQQYVLEGIADKIDAAFLRYQAGNNGFIFSRSRQRDSLIGLAEPADREVVTIRLEYHFVMWPQYLTQYSGSL